MEKLLIAIVNGLVEKKEEASVTVSKSPEDITVYNIHTAKEDVGRIIGKNGKIIHAIRTVMRAAASKNGIRIAVEIDS
ncbi:MAG: KH domain-containing protein [Oscillospiraceae bacterium]|nr:KH domain-containing protein [Oscillospiraceae bacterium]